MKIVLASLLALITAAGAYFSYDQNEQFKAKIVEHNEAKQSDQDWTVKERDMLEVLNQTQQKKTELTTDKERVTGENNSAIAKNNELKQELESVDQQLAALKKKTDDLNAQLAKYNEEYGTSSVQEIVKKRDDLEAANKELQTKLEGMKGEVAKASEEHTTAANALSVREKEQSDYRHRISQNSAEYNILSVEPRWGFVVIGAGEGSAIENNSTLLVIRNGRSVGKVKVVSLEKSQTVADIVKDSVAPGMTIQAGDHVQLLDPRK